MRPHNFPESNFSRDPNDFVSCSERYCLRAVSPLTDMFVGEKGFSDYNSMSEIVNALGCLVDWRERRENNAVTYSVLVLIPL